jgi:hypothetical protein
MFISSSVIGVFVLLWAPVDEKELRQGAFDGGTEGRQKDEF